MKKLNFYRAGLCVAGLLLLLMPGPVHAQTMGSPPGNVPPISAPLVREGDLAAKLGIALGVVTTDDEIEAESRLGTLGIAPKNGWIADYPVTPDIIGELEESIATTAAAGKLSMGKDEALKRLDDVAAQLGASVRPYAEGEPYQEVPPSSGDYPNPTVINNYYTTEGPPVVTYYAPPPDYYYLYSWIAYPFWWSGFWFPGYFILNDFHRTVVVDHHHHPRFISNHFNDFTHHRVFRVDPVYRHQGKTFAGIGAPHARGYISTGIPRSDRRIFNEPPRRTAPGAGAVRTPSRGGRISGAPTRGTGAIRPSSRGTGVTKAPSRGREMTRPPSGGRMSGPTPQGRGMAGPSPHSGRSSGTPSQSGKAENRPSRGGEGFREGGQRR